MEDLSGFEIGQLVLSPNYAVAGRESKPCFAGCLVTGCFFTGVPCFKLLECNQFKRLPRFAFKQAGR